MIIERSNAILLPFTLALLSTAACGGSTSDNTASKDSGAAEDSGTTTQDAEPIHDAMADTHVAADSGSMVVDSGPVMVDGGKFVAVPLDMCGPALQYTATATIGGTQNFELALDTGSTTLGVAATGCSNCGVAPLYTPGASAMDLHQTVNAMYASGGWIGEIYQDQTSLDPSATVPMKFGAMTSQTMFLGGATCQLHAGGVQGIVGFGPDYAASPGTYGFFTEYVATENIPNLFAMRLCDTTGTLWLGGFDGTAVTAEPQYLPLQGDTAQVPYYLVDFETITIGTTKIQVGNGTPSLLDTGTSIFAMATASYNTLVAALEADSTFSQYFGANFFPPTNQGVITCVSVAQTKAQLDAILPPLTLTLGTNPTVTVKAAATESYLYYGGQTNQWCAGIAGFDSGGGQPPAILGAPVLKSNVIIVDRANQRVGFAPHAPCP